YLFQYRYPYPLAHLYRRHATAHDPVDRVGYLLAAAEASLKFLAAATLGVLDTRRISNLKALTRPTFGMWLQLVRELTSLLGSQGEKTLYVRSKLAALPTTDYFTVVAQVVAERNDFIHGRTLTTGQARALLEAVE